MNKPKVEVDGLKVTVKIYPRELEFKFANQWELDNFLLQLIFAEVN